MNCEIFIVTYRKHFPWLSYCLKSIAKNVTGFSGVTLLVPDDDHQEAIGLASFYSGPLTIRHGAEWPGKGMLWHMAQIMRADEWCPGADYIGHFDSDCMFVDPVSPADYFENGKPIMYYESFKSLGRTFPEVLKWQDVVQKCLPFKVRYETMRRPFCVYNRNLYRIARDLIELKTRRPMDDYIKDGRNEFPQTFCEFNTLGNVAKQCQESDYAWYDLEKNPWPMQKVVQFWSHSMPDVPQSPIYHGNPIKCTPDYFLKL